MTSRSTAASRPCGCGIRGSRSSWPQEAKRRWKRRGPGLRTRSSPTCSCRGSTASSSAMPYAAIRPCPTSRSCFSLPPMSTRPTRPSPARWGPTRFSSARPTSGPRSPPSPRPSAAAPPSPLRPSRETGRPSTRSACRSSSSASSSATMPSCGKARSRPPPSPSFVVAREPVGVLLLAADAQDFSERAWIGFASTLARQFGQTIAVGQSLFRGAASEARYRTLMEHANDAILLVDNDGIVEANQQTEALLRRPRSAIVGHRYDEFLASTQSSAAVLHDRDTTRTEDQLLRRPDGSTVAVDVSASTVRIGEETIVLLVLRDITERKEAERRLQESEEQYRLLFDSQPHPMTRYDPDRLAFLAVNDSAVHLYGYTRAEFLAMTLADIRPASEVPRLLARLAEDPMRGKSSDGTWRHQLKDGTIIDVETSSNSIVFRGRAARFILVTDVSEKKRLETQLRQAQKMEAIGRLAGGVAHDFNNLLGVITGYGELLRKALGHAHPEQRRVSEIQKAAERAANLTRQLLAFSRKQVLETKILDLNEVVTGLEGMLHRLIGEDVRLVTTAAPAI